MKISMESFADALIDIVLSIIFGLVCSFVWWLILGKTEIWARPLSLGEAVFITGSVYSWADTRSRLKNRSK